VINDHAQRTGKYVLFAFNLTDDYDNMHRHYDKLIALGGIYATLYRLQYEAQAAG